MPQKQSGAIILKACMPCSALAGHWSVVLRSFDRQPVVSVADDCADLSPNCADWASKNECQKNPNYMTRACKASCNVCTPNNSSKAVERVVRCVCATSDLHERCAVHLDMV